MKDIFKGVIIKVVSIIVVAGLIGLGGIFLYNYFTNNILGLNQHANSSNIQIVKEKLKETFLELQKYECDFKDCMHIKEKGCKVIEAMSKGIILPSRYINYTRFIKECHENNRKLYK